MRLNLQRLARSETTGGRRPLGGRYDPLPSRVHLRRGHRLRVRILRIHRHRKP